MSISLEALDRTQYVVGNRVVYEVVITNTSRRAFAFPTSIDPRIVRRGMSGARLAAVSLVFADDVFGDTADRHQNADRRTRFRAPSNCCNRAMRCVFEPRELGFSIML